MDFFRKWGGVQSQSKSFGALFVPQIFGTLSRKGGGLTNSKSFWELFVQILGKLWHKIVPQKFQKFGLSKKCPKSSKIQGGGVGPLLEEVHKKGAFFMRSSLI